MTHRHIYNRPVTTATDRGQDWRSQALCASSADPELWFPDGLGSNEGTAPQAQEALAICHQCPVRAECLEWAIALGAQAAYGVWGGTTEEQRQSLRRRARREARA